MTATPIHSREIVTLDQYAVARVQGDIGDTSQERTTAAVQGLLARSYYELAIGQDDRYAGFKLLAGKVYEHYQAEISGRKSNLQRIGLPPFADLNRAVLNQLLDPQQGATLRHARRHSLATGNAGGNQCAPHDGFDEHTRRGNCFQQCARCGAVRFRQINHRAAAPNGGRKMIKLPESRNHPCVPATVRETMAGRCAAVQSPAIGNHAVVKTVAGLAFLRQSFKT